MIIFDTSHRILALVLVCMSVSSIIVVSGLVFFNRSTKIFHDVSLDSLAVLSCDNLVGTELDDFIFSTGGNRYDYTKQNVKTLQFMAPSSASSPSIPAVSSFAVVATQVCLLRDGRQRAIVYSRINSPAFSPTSESESFAIRDIVDCVNTSDRDDAIDSQSCVSLLNHSDEHETFVFASNIFDLLGTDQTVPSLSLNSAVLNSSASETDDDDGSFHLESLPVWSTASSPANFIFEGLQLCGEAKSIEPSYATPSLDLFIFDVGHPSIALEFDSLRPCLELPDELIQAIPAWIKNVSCTLSSSRQGSEGVYHSSNQFPCSIQSSSSSLSSHFFPPPLSILVSDSQSMTTSVINVEWKDLMLSHSSEANASNTQSSSIPLCILSSGSIIDDLVFKRSSRGASVSANGTAVSGDGEINVTRSASSILPLPPVVRLGYMAWKNNKRVRNESGVSEDHDNNSTSFSSVTEFGSLTSSTLFRLLSFPTSDGNVSDDEELKYAAQRSCCCHASREAQCGSEEPSAVVSAGGGTASSPSPPSAPMSTNSSSTNSSSANSTTAPNTSAPISGFADSPSSTPTSPASAAAASSTLLSYFRYVFASDLNLCVDTRCFSLLFLQVMQIDEAQQDGDSVSSSARTLKSASQCEFVPLVSIMIAAAVCLGVGEVVLVVFERYVQRRVLEISISAK